MSNTNTAESVTAEMGGEGETFVTFTIADQRFGVPVFRVQDILTPERISPVPLAPPAVLGSINLRGRIVTVVDVRTRLGMPPREDGETGMGVTVEYHNDYYTLLVDRIGDIVELPLDWREDKPSTLGGNFREISAAVFRMEEGLLVVLDVDRLLDLG